MRRSRTLAGLSIAVAALIACLLPSHPASTADGEVPDEIATRFIVPLEGDAGAKNALVFPTTSDWWFNTTAGVRRGDGVVLEHVWKDLRGATCRLWIEAEPLGGRKLAKAADDWIAALPKILEKNSGFLTKEAKRDAQPKKLTFGATKVSGYRIQYREQLKGALNDISPQNSEAFCFDVGDSFVVVTYQKYGDRPGDVFALLNGWKIEPLATVEPEPRIKVSSASVLPMRFATVLLPQGFLPKVRRPGAHAAWERKDPATGKVLARIQLDVQFADAKSDAATLVEARRAKYALVYEDVPAATVPVTTTAGPAHRIDFTDKTADDGSVWRATAVIVPDADVLWTWILETRSEGNALEAERTAFVISISTARQFRQPK